MTASMLESRGQGSAGGIRVSSLPTWAIWSIAAVALLSPVLAFLIAVAVEFLIGSLMDLAGSCSCPSPPPSAGSWFACGRCAPEVRVRPGREQTLAAC
jgi:hypothetical protein